MLSVLVPSCSNRYRRYSCAYGRTRSPSSATSRRCISRYPWLRRTGPSIAFCGGITSRNRPHTSSIEWSSVPFLAQYAARHNAHQHADTYPRAAETVLESTYMDDSMDSVRSDEEGVELVRQLSALWHKASMHPRKWQSNSTTILQTIPEEDRAEEINLTKGELPNVKTLGVLWLAKEDQFTFQLQLSEIGSNPTKRAFLSATASLYDPLGLLAPYLVQAKVLLQEMWLCGTAWDEQLPPAIVKKVLGWLEQVTELSTVRVPRCLTATGRTAISSHFTCSQMRPRSHTEQSRIWSVTMTLENRQHGLSQARSVWHQ